MFEKFRPLADRILVKRLDSEAKTTSGIIIPDTAKDKTYMGVVIATGPGRMIDNKIVPLTVNVNDVVYFGKYAGTEAGEDHLVIREDDVLGIVEQ